MTSVGDRPLGIINKYLSSTPFHTQAFQVFYPQAHRWPISKTTTSLLVAGFIKTPCTHLGQQVLSCISCLFIQFRVNQTLQTLQSPHKHKDRDANTYAGITDPGVTRRTD